MSDGKEFPSDKADKFVVRFPDGMRERIRAAAEANNRSMNAEIIARLQASFVSEADFRVGMRMSEEEKTAIDRITEAIEKLDYLEVIAKKLNDASVMNRIDDAIKNADLVSRLSQLLDETKRGDKATSDTPRTKK